MDRIVVGVDGSSTARSALRWAAAEGALHGASVTAVMAWSYLDQTGGQFDPGYGEVDARRALEAAVASAGPGVEVLLEVVNDLPAPALLEAGSRADLLVVGSRGVGGFKGLLLGSVTERILEHVPCPVAVVKEVAPVRGAVVVGIDGSPTSDVALRWAADEAARRDADLHVVHAWQVPVVTIPAAEQMVDAAEAAGRQVLDRALADPRLAGLRVEGHLPSEGASRAMLALADQAALMVVGSRGLGRLGRVLLGSTSRQLAHHAPVPLVVVPPAEI